MGKHAVGIIVDSVTEVSTIRDPDIERNSEVTSSLDGSIIGVGKQGNRLTIILDLVKDNHKEKINCQKHKYLNEKLKRLSHGQKRLRLNSLFF